MIKAEDIPEDVFWVWNIQHLPYPIDLDTYDKMQIIIRANPKYFPWETKYDSIPQHVHDAYFKEKNAEWDKIWEEKKEGGFKGIIPTLLEMNEMVPDSISTPEKSLTEIIADAFKRQDEQRKAEEEKYKQDKALWDKHYKPYGLEYRK